LCFQTKDKREAKAAEIKAKIVNGGDDTVEEFVVTVLK